MTTAAMNLIPERARQARLGRRHLKKWGIACASSFALMTIPLGFDWYQHARAEELSVQAGELAGQLTTMRVEVEEATVAAREALLHLERANALRSKRNWSGMLAMLGACMPAECWLTSIATDPAMPSGATRSPKATKSKGKEKPDDIITIEAPRKLRLTGYALEAAHPLVFVGRLKDTGIFNGVTLEQAVLEMAEGESRFQFELVCEW